MGGGHGLLLALILQRNPALSGESASAKLMDLEMMVLLNGRPASFRLSRPCSSLKLKAIPYSDRTARLSVGYHGIEK